MRSKHQNDCLHTYFVTLTRISHKTFPTSRKRSIPNPILSINFQLWIPQALSATSSHNPNSHNSSLPLQIFLHKVLADVFWYKSPKIEFLFSHLKTLKMWSEEQKPTFPETLSDKWWPNITLIFMIQHKPEKIWHVLFWQFALKCLQYVILFFFDTSGII